jgi:hypothetical protein
MDPGKIYQYSPKKKTNFSRQDDPYFSQSVDGLFTSTSSNPDSFPNFGQSGYLELSGSGDLDLFSVESSLPNISRLARTQAGSKKMQQIIAKSRPEEIDKIVDFVADMMGELMVDKYGNYMCQTLVQSCSAAQRLKLLNGMKNSLVKIACDPKGTHALQNLIALANLHEEEQIYQQSFVGHIVRLAKDQYATHVIQRLLVTVKNTYFIIKELLGHVQHLSMDKLGLCVIKKCVKNPQIFTEVLGSCLILMQDPYGNYAIQTVLETWKEECGFEFVSSIQNKAAQLCIQKYASNVMEKAMKVEVIRKAIIRELINEDKLDLLMGSPYGCYVLKTAVLESDREEKVDLKRAFEMLGQKLHNSKLQSQWEEIFSIFRGF